MGPIDNSLSQVFVAKHGAVSKTNSVLKKLKTINNPRWLKILLSAYVDENTKPYRSDPSAETVASTHYEEMVADGDAPKRQGVDYVLTRESVRVFGFLNEKVSNYQETCSSELPAGWQELIARLWIEDRRKHKKQALHFVFSMDPRFSLALGEDGIPVADVLNAAVTETMMAFQHRFYSGKSLGWLSGLHHDRIHAHSHVLLYPTTSDGVAISISDGTLSKVNGDELRIDYHSALHEAYSDAVKRQLAIVRGTRFADPKSRRAIIIESLAGIAQAKQLLVQEKIDISPEALTERWQRGLNGDITLNAINDRRNALAKQSLAPRFDGVTGSIDALNSTLPEIDKVLARMVARHRKYQKDTEALKSSPAAYRRISRVPTLPADSPSGTMSYLTKVSGVTVSSRLTRSAIETYMNEAMNQYDALIKEIADRREFNASFDPALSQQMQRRAGPSSIYGFGLLEALRNLRGLPPMAYEVDLFSAMTSVDLQVSRDHFNDRLREAVRAIGHLKRSATYEELLSNHNRRRLGKFDRQTGEVPNLTVPRIAPVIPSTPNFLERELNGKSLRTIKAILQEQSNTLERFRKIIPSGETVELYSIFT